MATLRKRMCIGLEKRGEWGVKIKEVLQRIVGAVGVELSDEELARLAAIPGDVENLIYSGLLRSFILEFAGETCEVVLEYYPAEDKRDDLDLSLLDVVDWDVESITLRIRVEDLSYAEAISGPALMSFCSERLIVKMEQADGGEPEPSGDGSDETGSGKAEEEEDEGRN